ncbi:hypothetical protein IV487_08340 [Enterococcus saccharolyticus]|uniref:hypothetical protein n=1 Tax=Enterococcus TaxID=1350 RepID=UPI0013794B33|nr:MULTISPECIES: hypothetical protein [Enterococcus]MCD5002469.1 hypothetical protein [Enterococcus saccharolyticus]
MTSWIVEMSFLCEELVVKIICLHASSYNIALVDEGMRGINIEVDHVVDQQLLHLIQREESEQQYTYIHQKLQQLIAKKPDAILITCTNYIALLEQRPLISEVPLLMIDEMLFKQLPKTRQTLTVLFTNKQIVTGTLQRLRKFCPWVKQIEIMVIDNVFSWYLAGEITKHDARIYETLLSLGNGQLMAAQLSMSRAVERYNQQHQQLVIHPLEAIRKELSMFKNE